MIKYIKKIVFKVLLKNAGKTKYQSFYTGLYNISLLGMNYGGGSYIEDSGELNALHQLKIKLGNRSKLTFFDVGANVGNYSLQISSIFSGVFKIYAFEPSLETFKLLSKNVSDHKQISIYPYGMSNEKVEGLTLYSNMLDSGLSSLYERNIDHKNIKLNTIEKINLSTIDLFCSENKVDKINLLKIDVEGHELNVINGAINAINNNKIEYIQFEFGGSNIDSKVFFRDIYYALENNYNFYRILKDGLQEIKNYEERLEIFVTTNYLCEIKDKVSF